MTIALVLIRQLEYLVALASERHFGRAAIASHVSQPALSEGIRRLEAELGVPIVRRDRSFQGFTPEGERVLAWAQRIIADRDGLLDELAAGERHLTGRLRIATIPAATQAATDLLARLAAEHPHLRISLLSLSSIEIARRLENFTLEAGLTYLDNEPLVHLRATHLERERLVLVTAVEAAPERRTITWADAARLPLCLLTPDMQNRRIIDAAFARAGVKAEPQLEADTIPALIDLIASGPWATIVSDTWARDPRVAITPLVKPTIEHAIGFVTLDRDPLPPATRALLALARRIGNGSAGLRRQNIPL